MGGVSIMKKISILAIAPYEGMAELLNSIAREREDIDMTVRVGNLKDGVKIVQELTEDFTYDAVISRGGTAEMIRSVCDVAVTDIQISVYDILRYIKMAEYYGGKYAITGFRDITSSAKILCDLLQYKIDIITFTDESEVLPTLLKLKENNYSLVICDMISFNISKSISLNAFLVTSGREALLEALDRAVSFVHSISALHKQKELFKAALTRNNESIMIFDENNRLWFSTLTGAPADRQLSKLIQDSVADYTGPKEKVLIRRFAEITCQISNSPISYSGRNYSLLKIEQKPSLYSEEDGSIAIYNDFNEMAADEIFAFNSVNLIGKTHEMLEKYARTQFPVLITGEVGTGKEKAAALLYKYGPNGSHPYYVIDCSLISERNFSHLLTSNSSPFNDVGSTIHIKLVGELSKKQLEKFSNYMENTRLARRNRLIFTLVKPHAKAELIEKYLANRLSCLLLPLMPLRERIEDISSIAALYINQMNLALGKQVIGFEPSALQLVREYPWPNNLDQFRRVLKELSVITDTAYITERHTREILAQETFALAPSAANVPSGPAPSVRLDLSGSLDQITKEVINLVLAEENMNREKTAKRLGISRTTLWRSLKS